MKSSKENQAEETYSAHKNLRSEYISD